MLSIGLSEAGRSRYFDFESIGRSPESLRLGFKCKTRTAAEGNNKDEKVAARRGGFSRSVHLLSSDAIDFSHAQRLAGRIFNRKFLSHRAAQLNFVGVESIVISRSGCVRRSKESRTRDGWRAKRVPHSSPVSEWLQRRGERAIAQRGSGGGGWLHTCIFSGRESSAGRKNLGRRRESSARTHHNWPERA